MLLECIFLTAYFKKKATAILSHLNFELTYFNCDLHIFMCYEGAERDIDNEPPHIEPLVSLPMQHNIQPTRNTLLSCI